MVRTGDRIIIRRAEIMFTIGDNQRNSSEFLNHSEMPN